VVKIFLPKRKTPDFSGVLTETNLMPDAELHSSEGEIPDGDFLRVGLRPWHTLSLRDQAFQVKLNGVFD
jgi:hypothetical protein